MKNIVLSLIVLLLPIFLFSQVNCLNFDGGNYDNEDDNHTDHVAIGNITEITNQFTAECWFNTDTIISGQFGHTIMASSTTTEKPLWLTLVGDEISVFAFVSSNTEVAQTKGANIEIGRWYHLAVVSEKEEPDDGRTLVYLDGEEVLDFATKSSTDWNSIFTIGDLRPNRSLGFDGKICGVRLWSDLRTPGEIQSYMFSELTGTDDNLVGAWLYDSSNTQIYRDMANDYDGQLGFSPTADVSPNFGDPIWIEENPLPVILSTFNVVFQNSVSVVTWATQSETANYGWNIYRSGTELFENSQINNDTLIEGAGTTSLPTYYTFTDTYELIPERIYWYWLESINFSGESEFYGPLTIETPAIENPDDIPEIPEIYGLDQNYPNPFNPSTNISFTLPLDDNGELAIYDIKGQKIKTIFIGHFSADYDYDFVWNGDDKNGKRVSSGTYFYRLKTEMVDQSKKMILVK